MEAENGIVSRAELVALKKEMRSFRRVFGLSIIVIVVVLIYTLPVVIENTAFRSQRVLELQTQAELPVTGMPATSGTTTSSTQAQ